MPPSPSSPPLFSGVYSGRTFGPAEERVAVDGDCRFSRRVFAFRVFPEAAVFGLDKGGVLFFNPLHHGGVFNGVCALPRSRSREPTCIAR